MSIRQLKISGFRSLADVIWNPGPLNLIIGTNGSGKSNLLRALELLKSSAEGKLSDTVRKSGGMVPLMWDGRARKISLSCMFEKSPAKYYPVTYYLTLEQLGNSGGFQIEREELYDFNTDISSDEGTLKFLQRAGNHAVVMNSLQTKQEIDPQLVTDEETLLSQLSDSSSYPVLTASKRLISNYSIYNEIQVGLNSEMRRAAVSHRDLRIEPDGSNLISVLHTLYESDRYFKEDLNQAMKAAFGNEFEELVFPPAEDGRIQLRVRWRSLQRGQSASDLSDGTLRFLFMITALASPEPPPLIAIDEPETGLHPSMFPLVAEHAIDAARRTQIILTTHAPQFLNAFRSRADITTIAEWREGKTVLRRLSEIELAKWLEHYQLGDLMLSGELESIE